MRAVAIIALLLACSSPPAPRPIPIAPPPVQPVQPTGGVLARTTGTQGVIEVIEQDGMRRLVIGGVVHAAVRVGEETAADPLVTIVRRVRPGAKTALVIGLGSGRTADQLAATGVDVLAVELEQAVADYAQKYFGYRGKVVVGDGLAYVEQATRRWDVIVVDALSATGLPAAFVTAPAIAALRARLTDDTGVLAVRMVDQPGSTAALAYMRRAGDWRHHLVLGSGIGDEQQNLYLLDAERPLSLDADPALPVWPLAVPGRTTEPVPRSRDVTLLGYLVRVGADQTLCLDLLHWEMGAVRFVIGGALVGELAALVPAGESPSSGDIGTDGDTAKTLKAALGGADFKRSDVRYSPTVVVLRGTASFRTAIDADDLERLHRGSRLTQPLLPHGGVLYDLAATELAWKFRLADWQTLRKRTLAPIVARLHAAARRLDIRAMRTAGGEYVKALETALGEWASKFQTHRSMTWLVTTLIDVDTRDRAKACGQIIEAIQHGDGYWVNPDLAPIIAMLEKCAG